MLCGNYILSNRSEWTFYFLLSVQFNFTISDSKNYEIVKEKIDNNMLDEYEFENIPTKENGNKLFISGV